MNPHLFPLPTFSFACGSYGLGFIAAPLLAPLIGPIGAFVTSMAGGSIVAVAANWSARRHVQAALHRRLDRLAAREKLLDA